jgi:hypothetical protein
MEAKLFPRVSKTLKIRSYRVIIQKVGMVESNFLPKATPGNIIKVYVYIIQMFIGRGKIFTKTFFKKSI